MSGRLCVTFKFERVEVYLCLCECIDRVTLKRKKSNSGMIRDMLLCCLESI